MYISRTVSSFVPTVRQLTRDTSETAPFRSDATICKAVADAVVHLRSVRPSARYDADGRLDDVAFPTDADALAKLSLSLEERWQDAVAYYAAAKCYEQEVTDGVSLQLAQTLFKRAEAEFQK